MSEPSHATVRPDDGRPLAIIDAAFESFDELGYDASTIEDIRRRSGASVGSIYHHFGSKAAIAAAVYLEGLEEYQRGLLARMRRSPDAPALIRSVIYFYLEWAKGHPTWARFLFSMRQADAVAAHDADIRARNERFPAEVQSYMSPFIDSGEIAPLPPQILLALVHGPVREFLRLWLRGQTEVPISRAREIFAQAAWQSVRAGKKATVTSADDP